MGKSMVFAMASVVFLFAGCDQIGEQTSQAIEQRVQQETGKWVEKAIDSSGRILRSFETPKGEKKPKLMGDESVQAAGITPTLLNLQEAPVRVASVYCTFNRSLDRPLEARFLNHAGAEIGRVKVNLSATAGGGRFIDFPIDSRIPISEIAVTSLRVP